MTSRRRGGREGPRGVSPAREAAFLVLRGVARRQGEPAALLHRDRFASLSSSDLDLANAIVLGVLRWQRSLDFILEHHAKRALTEVDETLLLALRIGLYQIRHLDRVPARAAVDESVKLARAFGASRGAGFVNAVLRGALRNPELPAFPRKERDPSRYLSTTLSHPTWLVDRYLRRLGLEGAEARCFRQNEPPPTYLRVAGNLEETSVRADLAREGVVVETVPEIPGCLRVLEGSPAGTSLRRDGRIFLQDAGSQLVTLLLATRPDDWVLDVCAAPGGKATAASERVPEGKVVACDRRPRRARLLRELSEKLGRDNLWTLVADGARLPFSRRFPRILLDVPCTSLGTLRRNPDVKWRVQESDLPELSRLQSRLLDAAACLLEPGGRLVYATCSTEPEENEEVVKRFLAGRSEFRPLDVQEILPEPARRFRDAEGALRTFPERDDTDGYYAVVLARRESR